MVFRRSAVYCYQYAEWIFRNILKYRWVNEFPRQMFLNLESFTLILAGREAIYILGKFCFIFSMKKLNAKFAYEILSKVEL